MRERRIFVLAKEHGQSPAQVRAWSSYDVERAWMYLTVESGNLKFTAADVKATKEKRVMAEKSGFVLDCDYSHWGRFIVDGALDEEKLKAGNYTPEQTEYIRSEMLRLGWLGSADETETEDRSDTAPLEPPPADTSSAGIPIDSKETE